jgi:hypothetical protein
MILWFSKFRRSRSRAESTEASEKACQNSNCIRIAPQPENYLSFVDGSLSTNQASPTPPTYGSPQLHMGELRRSAEGSEAGRS